MSREDIQAVVDNALVDNAVDMKDAFYNAINDKIFAAIEQRKIAVASNMLTHYGQQVETETQSEE